MATEPQANEAELPAGAAAEPRVAADEASRKRELAGQAAASPEPAKKKKKSPQSRKKHQATAIWTSKEFEELKALVAQDPNWPETPRLADWDRMAAAVGSGRTGASLERKWNREHGIAGAGPQSKFGQEPSPVAQEPPPQHIQPAASAAAQPEKEAEPQQQPEQPEQPQPSEQPQPQAEPPATGTAGLPEQTEYDRSMCGLVQRYLSTTARDQVTRKPLWLEIWPVLETEGWRRVSKGGGHFDFFPPGVRKGAPGTKRVHVAVRPSCPPPPVSHRHRPPVLGKAAPAWLF
eukprot:COSAG04_NODE_6209_length_1383_cov_1.692368_1_plen_290_part_00